MALIVSRLLALMTYFIFVIQNQILKKLDKQFDFLVSIKYFWY